MLFYFFGYRSHLDPHDDDSDDSSTDSDSPKIATPLDKCVYNINHHIKMYAPSKHLYVLDTPLDRCLYTAI